MTATVLAAEGEAEIQTQQGRAALVVKSSGYSLGLEMSAAQLRQLAAAALDAAEVTR